MTPGGVGKAVLHQLTSAHARTHTRAHTSCHRKPLPLPPGRCSSSRPPFTPFTHACAFPPHNNTCRLHLLALAAHAASAAARRLAGGCRLSLGCAPLGFGSCGRLSCRLLLLLILLLALGRRACGLLLLCLVREMERMGGEVSRAGVSGRRQRGRRRQCNNPLGLLRPGRRDADRHSGIKEWHTEGLGHQTRRGCAHSRTSPAAGAGASGAVSTVSSTAMASAAGAGTAWGSSISCERLCEVAPALQLYQDGLGTRNAGDRNNCRSQKLQFMANATVAAIDSPNEAKAAAFGVDLGCPTLT